MGARIRINKDDIPKDAHYNTVYLWYRCDGIYHSECVFERKHEPFMTDIIALTKQFKTAAIEDRDKFEAIW